MKQRWICIKSSKKKKWFSSEIHCVPNIWHIKMAKECVLMKFPVEETIENARAIRPAHTLRGWAHTSITPTDVHPTSNYYILHSCESWKEHLICQRTEYSHGMLEDLPIHYTRICPIDSWAQAKWSRLSFIRVFSLSNIICGVYRASYYSIKTDHRRFIMKFILHFVIIK